MARFARVLTALVSAAFAIRFLAPSGAEGLVPSRAWPIPDWAVATPQSQGMDAEKLEALRAYFEQHKTRAALVVRHGRIVGEWYWDGKDRDSTFQAWSVTKSITSTAVGLLVGDGKIKLDEPAADFIPTWKEDDRKAITIRHLLSMTSGLLKKEPDLFFQRDQLKFAVGQPLAHPPGTVWDYNNVACETLSAIVTAASGEEMGEYLQHRLFAPLGITHARLDKSGSSTLAYMGLNISARDLAKIGYLFLSRGEWNRKRILPESWIAQATTASQDLNPDYGLLWWLSARGNPADLPKDSYSAIGLFGNYLSVFPSQDMIVVRLIGYGIGDGKASDVDWGQFARLALAAIKE